MLFLPIWWIGIVVVLVILFLCLLFPRNLFIKALKSSSLSARRLNYLVAYQSQYRDSTYLRFKAIEIQLQLGMVKNVEKSIAALKEAYPEPNEVMDTQMLWLNYLLTKYNLGKVKNNMKKQVELLQQMRALTLILAKKPLELEQFKIVAQGALAYGQAPIALNIYNQLLQQGKLQTLEDLNQGGLIAMQNNAPKTSTLFYTKAYAMSRKLADQTYYAMKTMEAWWAFNRADKALSFGLGLPPAIQQQKEVQIYLARLALASNQPELAEVYLYRLLGVSVNDLVGLEKQLRQLPVQNQMFDLLYQASLYNKHLKPAYQVARIALDKEPQSILWHQRFAQIAIWRSEYNQGMKSWIYVFNHADKKKIREEAMEATKTLGFDQVLCTMLKTELKRHPSNLKSAVELASAENRLGEPQQAIDTLNFYFFNSTFNASKHKKTLRQAYAKKAAIYADMGELDKALQTFQARDQLFGYDEISVTEQAAIYYKQKNLKGAEQILKQGMSKIPDKNQEFWYALANLSWDFNDRETALEAYKHYKDFPQSLMQLIELNRVDAPEQALELSMMGFKKFHWELFLGNALTFIARLDDMPSFINLLHYLSDDTLIKAEKLPMYWQMLVKLYAYEHQPELQESLLFNAILKHPELPSLKIDLFWLVLMQGKSDVIRSLLQRWYPEEIDRVPGIWYPMAEGFNLENQTNVAMFLYQLNLLEQLQQTNDRCRRASLTDDASSLQAILDYTNVLNKTHDYHAAYDVRLSLWNWLLQHIAEIDDPLIAHHLLEQLAGHFASGTTEWWLNIGLLNQDDDQSLSLALNWFTQHQMVDWSTWIKESYPLLPVPDRIRLAMALEKNDLQALQDIQAEPMQTKPRTEHIQAAIRLENTADAESLMFKELSERPDAYEIYQDFVPMLLKDGDHTGVWLEKEQFVNIIGPRLKLESRAQLTNTWSIKPTLDIWSAESQYASQIVNVPHDEQYGLVLQEKIHRGQIKYNIQYREALNGFVPFDVEWSYQLSSRWQMMLEAGINQENYQTSYMRIGGVQDQLNAKFMGKTDKYNMVYAEIQGVNYFSQNRHYLGDGLILHGSDTYKLWLGYPDYTIGVFTDLFFLRRNGSFGGDVVNLFPSLNPVVQNDPALLSAEQNLQYQQLVPNSYYQGGVQFSFGDNIQEYSSTLRPYFVGRLYYNTLTLLSNDVKCGVVTTVFGHDSLAFYAEHGTAPAVATASTFKLGVRYVAYY